MLMSYLYCTIIVKNVQKELVFTSDRAVKDVLPKELKNSGIRLNFPAWLLPPSALFEEAEDNAERLKNCDKGIRVK